VKVTLPKHPEYVDIYESCSVALVESEDGDDKYRTVEGVASQGNILNRNLRYYPTKVLEKCSKRAKKELVSKNKFVGEVDHPWGVRSDLKDVAVLFTDLWMEGDLMKFKGKIVKNPKGEHLESLLEAGVSVGVSTRGYGSTKLEKKNIGGTDMEVEVIQDDFVLTGVDFVMENSNPAGEVTKFESKEEIELEIKTVEQLKAFFPELSVELTAAAVKEAVDKITAELKATNATELATAVEAAKAEAVAAYKESAEGKKFDEAIKAIVTAISPLLPESVRMQETDLTKENAELKVKIATVEAAKTAVDTELAILKAEKEAVAQQTKMAEAIEAKIKGHKFADKLRTRLSECKTEAELDEKFKSETAFLESFTTAPAGSGKVQTESEQHDEKPALTEAQKRMRFLSGLKE